MDKDVIIACDFSSEKATLDFLEKFKDRKPYVKIGMELYYAEGPQIVRKLKQRGHKVFLDLKLHDIPNTVNKAMRVLSNMDVDMCNLHASGTVEMMKAGLKGLIREDGSRPLLIAVTQLTSTTEERMRQDLLIEEEMNNVVSHYALNAKKAGLDGVVCSPLESPDVHRICGDEFITVTPGVRLEGDNEGDQARVTTPAKARKLGSDYIVIGRSITDAENPVDVYDRCLREFREGIDGD